MVTRRPRAVQAVIFDYGGLIRCDSREAYDPVDVAQGLARGTLWEVFHDIPEYHLSRNSTIDRDTFHAAIRRVLSQRAGEERTVRALPRLSARLATTRSGACNLTTSSIVPFAPSRAIQKVVPV